jgi:4a-hydroxytetrahydrobiopterin dehydratase
MTKNNNKVLEFVKKYNWQIKDNALFKKYTFSNFSLAINFINQIAVLSEENNHHPKLVNNYNLVEVFWTTNDVGNITQKDIELAKHCDHRYLKNT